MEAIKQIFNFSTFSAQRRIVIYTTALIIFFGLGGYLLTKQLVKYIDLLLAEKDKQIEKLEKSGIYKDMRYDKISVKFEDYIDKIRRRDDSIAADDRIRFNEIIKK